MIAGSKHAANLVVSLASLREQYAGPVAIVTEQSGLGREAAGLISADKRLGDTQVICDGSVQSDAVITCRGHGAIHASKTNMPLATPFESTVLLDCDTVVVRPIDELWPRGDETVLTGFDGMVSNKRPIVSRINAWQPFAPESVARCLSEEFPHVNTGVLGFCKQPASQEFSELWRRMALLNTKFSDDEIAAQLVMPTCKVRHEGGRFNCSPTYNPNYMAAHIWHCHSRMNYRAARGRELWLPRYEAALRDNLGGIARWPVHRYNWASLDTHWRARLTDCGVRITRLLGPPVDPSFLNKPAGG
jgi:hypothetical protein